MAWGIGACDLAHIKTTQDTQEELKKRKLGENSISIIKYHVFQRFYCCKREF